MSLDSSNFFEILDKLNAGTYTQPTLDDPDLKSSIHNLNKKIQEFDEDNDIGQIMSAQTDMSQIMKKEKKYLEQREEQIQKDVETGERTMMLNDSTRKKYYAYITIVIVWVAVIIVILVLFYLSRIFGLPFNFLFALIMAVALFWTGWMLYQYSLRDPTDFDKLNLNRPFTGPGFKNPTNVNSSFLGSFGICIGDSCCPSGDVNSNVVYDKNNNRCVLKSSLNTTSSITTPFQGGGSSITTPFQGGAQGSQQGSVPEQGPGSGPSGSGPSGSGPSGLTEIGGNDNAVSSLGPSAFQNMNESFMTMGQLLSFYPPQIPMSLVQPYKYNYACESEQLYCNPKIDR